MMDTAEIRLRCLEIGAKAHPSEPTGYMATFIAKQALEFVFPPEPTEAPKPADPDDVMPF